MIGIAWNCQGTGHPSTIRSLRGYVKSHWPGFMFLSKVKCSSSVKIKKIFKIFNFSSFEFVPYIGKTGGLLLMRRQDINIKVIISSTSFINCLVFSKTFMSRGKCLVSMVPLSHHTNSSVGAV